MNTSQCAKCKTVFATKYSMQRHLPICKKRDELDLSTLTNSSSRILRQIRPTFDITTEGPEDMLVLVKAVCEYYQKKYNTNLLNNMSNSVPQPVQNNATETPVVPTSNISPVINQTTTVNTITNHDYDNPVKVTRTNIIQKLKSRLSRNGNNNSINNTNSQNNSYNGSVYLIRRADHTGIYKIGRTNRLFNKRFREYPAGSESYLHYVLKNSCCKYVERMLISQFNRIFTRRRDIGLEYYEGSLDDIKKKFNEIVLSCDV